MISHDFALVYIYIPRSVHGNHLHVKAEAEAESVEEFANPPKRRRSHHPLAESL